MQHPAVHWANGIFLRPHHFQAADRYWGDLVTQQQRIDHPVGYGIHSITISQEPLEQGILEVRGLRVRFREGPIVVQEDADVHRIELPKESPEFSQGKPITVFLAIPKHREGHANVATGLPAGDAKAGDFRFRECVLESADESAGGDRQPLRLRELNFQFLLSNDDRNGFETIPLARVCRSTGGAPGVTLDADYFPPSISLKAWSDLATIVRRIQDDLTSRMQSLGTQIREKRITFSSQTQGDVQKLMLLHALNEAVAHVSCLNVSPGVHPLTAFTALCQTIGRLSIFGPELIAPDFPTYDHDDLAPLFHWARKQIRKLIFSVRDDEFHQRYFVGAGSGMRVQLDSEWFGNNWEWYLGIHPINSSKEECLSLLRSRVDWVLGSSSEVENLFKHKIPGVDPKKLKQVPSFLPSGGNWIYFKIMTDNEAWRKVHLEQSLAMRVKREQIANFEQVQGKNRLQLSVDGKTYGMEFAIFAARLRN